MKRSFVALGLILMGASLSFGQLKGILKSISTKDVLRVVKKETVKQLQKSRDEYDPTDFNYAVSFSDNAGVFESEDKYRKFQKGILYALSPESLNDRTPKEQIEDYNDAGEMLYASGRFHSAEVSFMAARLIQKVEGTTQTKMGARVLSNMGLLYHTTGRYEQSEELTLQAMKIQKDEIQDKNGYGASVNNLAVLYKDMGRFLEAEDWFEKAVGLAEETKGIKSSAMAIVLNNKAILFQVLGRYKEAEKFLIRSIDIASITLKEKSPNYVRMKVNLALLYQLQKRYDEAEQIYLEAIKIKKRRLGTNHPDYAVMLRNLASLYQEEGETKKVEPLLLQATKIYKEKFNENHPVYAKSLSDLGNYYLSTGETEKCKPLLYKALSIQETNLSSHHPDLTRTRESIAILDWEMGNIEKAARAFKAVMEEYLYQVHTYFPSMSEYDKTKFWNLLYPSFIRYYNFVIDAQSAMPVLSEEFYNDHLATKALLLSATSKLKRQILQSGNSNLIHKYHEWEDLKNYLSGIYTLSKEQIKDEEINLDSLEQAANQKEKELSKLSNIFTSGFLKGEIKYQKITEVLEENEACLELIRVPRYHYLLPDTGVQYVALVLGKNNNLPQMAVFENGTEMEGKIASAYRTTMQRGFEKGSFYSVYWGVLEKLTSPYTKLYVSLDGIYNQINLNTLRSPTGKFLLDTKNIYYVMNTKEVPGVKKKANISASIKKQAILFGNPDYAKDFDWNKMKKMPLPELPGTKTEVEEIAKLLKAKSWNTTVYLGDNAKEEIIRKLQSPFILHIATHGFFLKDLKTGRSEKIFGVEPEKAMENPMLRSGLLFTGADNTIQSLDTVGSGNSNDGVLNAYESMFLNLENTNLVVLSACETGLGEIRDGEGVYGLQRAFQIAGASTLMISLWQVSDEVTQKLMGLFYQNWLISGNKAQAFRLAQEEIKKKYPAPFYWGPFVLINN